MNTPDSTTRMEAIVSLCKRRGFIFPSSEIYGGFSGVYDYGHYGTLLFNNVKQAWQKNMTQERIESFEKMFERHLTESTSIYDDVRKTNFKLEENGLKLERMLAILEKHEAEIKSLWAFPLKIMAAIVAVAGASSAVVSFVRWFIPRIEIGGPH
jgi:hypothetical protein